MDVALFKEAQQAYAHGDYETALNGFIDCIRDRKGISPSDLSKFYHLIGNCYMKSGDARSAAQAYTHALQISPEKRKPSLYVNLGTALLGSKEYEDALTAFTRALDYPIYTTPYKAYAGIGAAQLKLGNTTEAGAAYREAALDPTNPDPAKSLVNLGVCFMELDRADDAITSYETALEFNLTPAASAKVHANLGQAYLVEGRVNKALEAFEEATADGSYELSPMARHDYEIAKTLHDRVESRVPGVFDTGFIPSMALGGADASDKPAEMPLDASGHLPVYGEPDFDPFAPQTRALDAVPEEDGAASPEASAAEVVPGSNAESDDGTRPADHGASAGERTQVYHPPHRVDADGVDEDELERTLVELGIAPEQTKAPWDDEDDRTDGLDSADGARETKDPAAHEPPSDDRAEAPGAGDASSERTELLRPVPSGPSIDISTGEMPRADSEGEGEPDDAERGPAEDAAPDAPADGQEEPWLPDGGDEDDDGDGDGEQEFSPGGLVSEIVDSGEPLRVEDADTHMPSPENTQFFERTEKEIKQDARQARRRARKSRGVGLKVAIVVVVLAALVVAAGAVAYLMGYGYPTQEHVARSFFAAAENGSDTSPYWADDVDQDSRAKQSAVVQGLTSYRVEAVQRSMSQTVVYLRGTLQEGGQVDYEVVMNRDGLSWAIEYVELYFPSQQ